MNIEVRWISANLREVIIEGENVKMESGTLNVDEAKELARALISAAEELLS